MRYGKILGNGNGKDRKGKGSEQKIRNFYFQFQFLFRVGKGETLGVKANQKKAMGVFFSKPKKCKTFLVVCAVSLY